MPRRRRRWPWRQRPPVSQCPVWGLGGLRNKKRYAERRPQTQRRNSVRDDQLPTPSQTRRTDMINRPPAPTVAWVPPPEGVRKQREMAQMERHLRGGGGGLKLSPGETASPPCERVWLDRAGLEGVGGGGPTTLTTTAGFRGALHALHRSRAMVGPCARQPIPQRDQRAPAAAVLRRCARARSHVCRCVCVNGGGGGGGFAASVYRFTGGRQPRWRLRRLDTSACLAVRRQALTMAASLVLNATPLAFPLPPKPQTPSAHAINGPCPRFVNARLLQRLDLESRPRPL